MSTTRARHRVAAPSRWTRDPWLSVLNIGKWALWLTGAITSLVAFAMGAMLLMLLAFWAFTSFMATLL